jgi:hypothetical protein
MRLISTTPASVRALHSIRRDPIAGSHKPENIWRERMILPFTPREDRRQAAMVGAPERAEIGMQTDRPWQESGHATGWMFVLS